MPAIEAQSWARGTRSYESNVTTDIRPGVIRLDSPIDRALARNARGSNPGRDMLFFFALLVGYIFIIWRVSTFWRNLLQLIVM